MKEKKVFELEILHPTKFELVPVLWIEVEGLEGSFLVGASHAPLISMIKPKSIIRYKSMDGKEKIVDVFAGGVIEIVNNRAKIILDN